MENYLIGILIGIIVFIIGFFIGMKVENKHSEHLFEIALGWVDGLNDIKDELIKFYKDDLNPRDYKYYYRSHPCINNYKCNTSDEESE